MPDYYVQGPNMLLFGFPELSGNDKITLLALMSLAWGNEGPHQISIRELAKLIHISPATLCDSARGEEEKQRQQEQGKFREGILSRLERVTGYITVKEIIPTTDDGRRKQIQTFITIHLKKIWEDNEAFKKEHGVYNLNTRDTSKDVYNLNTHVRKINTLTPQHVYNSDTSAYNLNTLNPQTSSTSDLGDPLKKKEEINKENKKKEREGNKSSSPKQPSIKGIDILSFDQSEWFTNILCPSKIGSMVKKISKQVKQYIEKLMPDIGSVEQMNSLYDFSERKILADNRTNKTVYLGNLVDDLPEWRQAQGRTSQSQNENTGKNPDGYSSSADAKQAAINSILTPSTGGLRSLRGGRETFDKTAYVDTWGSSADAIEDTAYYSGDRRIVEGHAWPVRGEQVETG